MHPATMVLHRAGCSSAESCGGRGWGEKGRRRISSLREICRCSAICGGRVPCDREEACRLGPLDTREKRGSRRADSGSAPAICMQGQAHVVLCHPTGRGEERNQVSGMEPGGGRGVELGTDVLALHTYPSCKIAWTLFAEPRSPILPSSLSYS